MQSESKVVYSEDIFYSNVKFSLKGKGVARLISRDMHNGTIINLKDSTVSNIDFKKKKYSLKTFGEILENKKDAENKDSSNSENVNEELNEFNVSKEPEFINGFECYKLTIERNGTNIIWFSKTLREPDFVKIIKYKISDFQNGWANMTMDLTKYGIDKDSVIVKMSSESKSGTFDFELISFQNYSAKDKELEVPNGFKKVRKI